MRESRIEKHLVERCKALGIHQEKFTSPQRRSVPDRLLCMYGRAVFVELKATGARPTRAQLRDHERRRAFGMTVCWTDSIEGVEQILHLVAHAMPVQQGKY